MPKIVASKEDWMKLGYSLFSESGESGLIVEKMSRHLKCNKSSFYWHFKTKKDFINSLIDYWILNDTTNIIDQVNQQTSTRGKLVKLVEITFKKDSNLDFIFYLKRYSRKDKNISRIVEMIDTQRILYVNNLLVELGYAEQDASMKANLFYKLLIGYHEMIRYKKQNKNYLDEVLLELNQFIKI